ncbi:unnamed protein product [Nesidiocoris tenuis]|uniref:Uncharacterized protein n=1 Tax=Nesidiocoris tenuis TaxID=355587 RepID=A0A6H5HKN3_9HEMI|nr:unnamed protein product [Nesidiocoris tenuis]
MVRKLEITAGKRSPLPPQIVGHSPISSIFLKADTVPQLVDFPGPPVRRYLTLMMIT